MADPKQKVRLKNAHLASPLKAPLLPHFVAPQSFVDSSLRKNWVLWATAFPLLNGLVVWLVLSSFSNGARVGSCTCEWGTARPLQKLNRSMVILVSSDGFRWDYHFKVPTPNIDRLRLNGTEAEKGMIPVYPTLTFPNHYSIATGLYPASHGVIANCFSYGKEEFSAKTPDSKWWLGEPIWETVVKNNLSAAAFFWPGCEVKKGSWECPREFCPKFNKSVSFENRVDRVLEYTKLDDNLRPSLIALYFNQPDEAGHAFGPDAPQITDQVLRIDSMIGRLMDGLEEQGILDDVTIIMVGDHGMVGTCPDRVIYLEDLDFKVPTAWMDSYYPLWTIRPPPEENVGEVFQKITEGLKSEKVNNSKYIQMYLKEDLPARLHFNGSDRIHPIIGMLKEGYALAETRNSSGNSSESFCGGAHPNIGMSAKGCLKKPRSLCGGSHGYDNANLSMRTIFFARGPQFARGRKVPSFENVQLYNVMTSILGISGAPNNGTSSFAESVLLPKPKRHPHQSHSK